VNVFLKIKVSGAQAEREGRARLMGSLWPGDTVVSGDLTVWHSLKSLLQLVAALKFYTINKKGGHLSNRRRLNYWRITVLILNRGIFRLNIVMIAGSLICRPLT
jgi:hypothetical protein